MNVHTHMKPIYSGKVREIYDEGDTLIIKATDRLSGFDRYLCDIPDKGKVLTQLSVWWFEKTKSIIPNHFIALMDADTMRVRKCSVLPIEVVVRGFLTGSTRTSSWTLYEKGERQFFETTLPDGLQKNTMLPKPIITPTSKSTMHDVPLTPDHIHQWIAPILWEKIKIIALNLFQFGQQLAKKRGFVLVDTKYEFGLDAAETLCLIDECHTPDSSRFWKQNSIEHYDKEYLRLWYQKNSRPYQDLVLSKPPIGMIQEMSRRYIYLYEKITQKKLEIN